jgi:hypothetical protein
MALSDSLISAAAGLAGAAIGGFSTYAANRGQWRRESRRTAYTDLISTSYQLESVIKSGDETSEGARKEIGDGTDLHMQFSLQLDSATLLAKEGTQAALDEWRTLFRDMPHNFTGDGGEYMNKWQVQREEFYDYVKDELGAAGLYHYRDRTILCSIAAVMTLLGYGALSYIANPDTALQAVGYALYLASLYLLLYASQTAQKWWQRLERLNKPVARLKVRLLQSITVIAIVVSTISLFFGHSVVTFALGFLAAASVVVGLLVIVAGGQNSLPWGQPARAPRSG